MKIKLRPLSDFKGSEETFYLRSVFLGKCCLFRYIGESSKGIVSLRRIIEDRPNAQGGVIQVSAHVIVAQKIYV